VGCVQTKRRDPEVVVTVEIERKLNKGTPVTAAFYTSDIRFRHE
jgi:hypothetical protein